MNNKHRQYGFSLMEVMFAVVVLSLGLVFVACQFPTAIDQVRDVVDETNKIIDSHNSQVMLELELNQIAITSGLDHAVDVRQNGYITTAPPTQSGQDIIKIHALCKPNVLFAPPSGLSHPISGKDYPIVVIDDLEYYEDYILNTLVEEPKWPFWSQLSTAPSPYNGYYNHTNAFLGDIGNIMSPPVEESDAEVVKIIKSMPGGDNYDPTDPVDRVEFLHLAMFQVALERNYCWAALYHENSNEYYIFTLRIPEKQLRYALQDPASFVINQSAEGEPYANPPAAPVPGDPDMDRMFPVPWRVYLGMCQRYVVQNQINGVPEPWIGPDDFAIPEVVANILRTGSIIVDADPLDTDPTASPPTTGQSGSIYEVMEVYTVGVGNYRVRLRTPLQDDLHYFWVFPPPVNRAEEIFEDFQPVVEVTRKMINY